MFTLSDIHQVEYVTVISNSSSLRQTPGCWASVSEVPNYITW